MLMRREAEEASMKTLAHRGFRSSSREFASRWTLERCEAELAL
jgi:hypothetical protein